MEIMTFNVGIWTRNWKRSDPNWWLNRARAMRRMIKDQDPDVVCFQELWWPVSLFVPRSHRKVLGTGWEHPIYARKGRKASHSMFRTYWSFARFEEADVICVHGHWNAALTQKICNQLKDIYLYNGRPTVMAGDWNVSLAQLKAYLTSCESAREQQGLPRMETYRHFTKKVRAGEIDHIMVAGAETSEYRIIGDGYGVERISDHWPVVTRIKLPVIITG